MNHQTWLKLSHKGFNDFSKEEFTDYIARITKEFPNIPVEVLRQWIYENHSDPIIQKNYGWIDYHNVQFILETWSTEEIFRVEECYDFEGVVENYQQTANDKNVMRGEDLKSWKEAGTWRTPIVILKTDNILNPPIVFKNPYQLIEGHTRLGRLKAFNEKDSLFKISRSHQLWLMQIVT